MGLSLRQVTVALERAAGVSEWIALASSRHRLTRSLGRSPGWRDDHDERRLTAIIFGDHGGRRGSATVELTALSVAEATARIEAAARRAAAVGGPAWAAPPPGAPARVWLSDPAVARDPRAALERVVAALVRALPRRARVTGGAVAAELAEVHLRSSRGFTRRERGTRLELDVDVAQEGTPPLALRWRGRRLGDLDVGAMLAPALAAHAVAAGAAPPPAGRYDVVVPAAALVAPRLGPPGAGGRTDDRAALAAAAAITRAPATYGLFAPIVFHADGGRARLGLGRHQPGQPLLEGGHGSDPLTIASGGARDFGWHSASFGDAGEPVRRFELVRAGVVADLALDLQEAALRGAPANGGVRDLDVSSGGTPAARLLVPGDRPLLLAADLRWLDCEPRSGLLTLELGGGILETRGGRRPTAGGGLAGDAVRLLVGARRSRERESHAWLHGPRLWRFDDVELG